MIKLGKWLWLLFPSYIDSAHFHVATVWNGWHMLLQSFIPSKEFTLFMDGFNKVQLLWGGKKTKSVEKKLTASDEWSRTLSGPNTANKCLLSLPGFKNYHILYIFNMYIKFLFKLNIIYYLIYRFIFYI